MHGGIINLLISLFLQVILYTYHISSGYEQNFLSRSSQNVIDKELFSNFTNIPQMETYNEFVIDFLASYVL